MNNYITIQPIDEKIDFVNLAITLSNVNSKSREDMEVVCKDGNFNIKNLTSNIQIHSDIVNKIDESNIGQKKEGDALITNIPNTPLLIFTADCVPIAIIDKKNKAIGLAHAGWRGTYDAIAKKTIEKMADNYNEDANYVEELVTDFSAASEQLLASVSGVVANIQEVTKAANDGAASTGSIAERVTNVDRQAEDMRVLMKQTQEASLMLRKDTKKFTVA